MIATSGGYRRTVVLLTTGMVSRWSIAGAGSEASVARGVGTGPGSNQIEPLRHLLVAVGRGFRDA